MPKSTTNKPRNKKAPQQGEVMQPDAHLEDSATAMFLKEVDDAIHEENLKKFWNTWKYAILGGVAAIFVVSLAWQYYGQLQQQHRIAAAEEWMRMSSMPQVSEVEVAGLQAQGVAGISLLSQLAYAEQLLTDEKMAEAVAVYDAAAEEETLPLKVQNLVKLYAAIAEMHVDMAAAEIRFSAMDREDNPYRPTVWMLMAEMSELKNENAAALALWEKIAALPQVSQELKAQAEARAIRLQAMAVNLS